MSGSDQLKVAASPLNRRIFLETLIRRVELLRDAFIARHRSGVPKAELLAI